MTEKKIKEKIREAVGHSTKGLTTRVITSDVFEALNSEGVLSVSMTKQKLLKAEILIVVNDDFEDMDHEVHDALKTIENVEGVAAIRVMKTIPLEDEFDEMPLHDGGDIWQEIEGK